MDTKTLSVGILTLCVIAPLLMGFVMPHGTTPSNSYVVEDPLEISGTLENAEIPIPRTYTGFENNFFLAADWEYATDSETYTNVENRLPHLTPGNWTDKMSVSRGGVVIRIPDLFEQTTYPTAQMIELRGNNLTFYTGTEYVHPVYYFPSTELTYGISGDGALVPMDAYPVAYITSDDESTMLQYRIYTQVNGEYLDTADGLSVQYRGEWSNGWSNNLVAMVMEIGDLSGFVLSASNGWYVTASTVTGNIVLQFINGTSVSQAYSVGGADQYNKVLVVFDNDNDTIYVNGLLNMPSYDTWPTAYIGNTVTYDTVVETGIEMDRIDRIGIKAGSVSDVTAGPIRYYVPYTIQDSGFTEKVMEDVTASANGYKPTGPWAFTFGSATYYGTSVSATATGSNVSMTWNVVSGALKDVPFLDKDGKDVTEDVPLKGMQIMVLPKGDAYALFINGAYVRGSDFSSYSDLVLGLNGDWKMGLGVSRITVNSTESYEWKAGTFNLDMGSYSFIGLGTAVLSILVIGYYGRKTGEGMLVPMGVAAMCGIVYLAMLMS